MEKSELIKSSIILHQEINMYSKLKSTEKILTVSGILIALNHGFDINKMGNSPLTDGELLYYAICDAITHVEMDESKNIITDQFRFLIDTQTLNEINPFLHKTPLKHFCEFLMGKIYLPSHRENASNDYLGRFFTEFISYKNNDNNSLGITLTPSHITSLFAELLDVSEEDVVLEPCTGAAGFLISGMQKKLQQKTDNKKFLCDEYLHGYEIQHFMFTIACLNLILHGCKKIHIHNQDFLSIDAEQLRNKIHANVGMINPPYSLGSPANPELYEIYFVKQLLDSMESEGRVAAIIPTSAMTGKTKEIRKIKEEILQSHTLEGVITINPDTFYVAYPQTAIAVFTAWIPHGKNKLSKFIDFRDDGFKLSPHTGLLETEFAKIKRDYLLNVWRDKTLTAADFCVQEHVTASDEWLHSYFQHQNEIPSHSIFENTATEYLDFCCTTIIHGQSYLLHGQQPFSTLSGYHLPELAEKTWKPFNMADVFCVTGARVTDPKSLIPEGTVPRVSCGKSNNAIEGTYQNLPTEEGNVLTVDSATVGNIHYQQVPFFSSGHIEILKLRERNMNVFIGLFLASSISFAITGKYNYGYKFNKARIRRQIILLPTDDSNNIDYDYMEKYMMTILKKKYEEFLEVF